MTHEYDDPISGVVLAHATALVRRWQASARELSVDALVIAAVEQAFCTCVTGASDAAERHLSTVRAAILREVQRRVQGRDGGAPADDSQWDEVDRASAASFPASDPPGWIGR